jgi:hypothetical protein
MNDWQVDQRLFSNEDTRSPAGIFIAEIAGAASEL